VRQALEALAQGRHDPSRSAAFAQHTQQVDALRELVLAAAERSGLPLDPEAHGYFLMDVTVEQPLPWTETLGLVRGEGAGEPRSDAHAQTAALSRAVAEHAARLFSAEIWSAIRRPSSTSAGRPSVPWRPTATRCRTTWPQRCWHGPRNRR
jgi:hypothetical protein